MTPLNICENINRFLITGLSKELFLAVENHKIVEQGKISEVVPSTVQPTVRADGINKDEFVHLLDNNSYSAVFFDGSILSIKCQFLRKDIIAHRYLFLPCPIDREFVLKRPEQITIADWIRDINQDNLGNHLRSTGYCRFDYRNDMKKQHGNDHPTSHLTLAAKQCRIPLKAPLMPTEFFQFIFSNFYQSQSDLWEPYSPYLRCSGNQDSITNDEAKLLHMSWN